MTQVKAQTAVNGCSLNKGCNVGLGHLWDSLRARREAVICCVASRVKGMPFPARRALQLTASRHADMYPLYVTPHSRILTAVKLFVLRYNMRMSLKYDLHTHSTASDGTLTPAELARHAARCGVDMLALTDHDTTEGVVDAAREAARQGVGFVPGVEVSVSWGRQTIHLLGLGVDPACQRLQAGLKGLREFRSWRAEEIGRRLVKSGIPGAYEGARALSSGTLIARTHFARYLVDQGHAPTLRKVFQHFLVRGKPGYVPGQWAELSEAVSWIKTAGGQAVIAHPARYPLTRTRLRRLLAEFSEAGGEGLEVISGSHSADDSFKMAKHAADFQLLASAGSDYHGPENPWIDLGRLPPFPTGTVPIWRGWGSIGNTGSRKKRA